MKTLTTSIILILFSSFVGIVSKIYFYDKYIFYSIEQERYEFEKSLLFTKNSLYDYAEQSKSDSEKKLIINFDSVSTISAIKIKIKNEYNEKIKDMEIYIPAFIHYKHDFLSSSVVGEFDYSINKENVYIKINNIAPNSNNVYLFYFSGISFYDNTLDEKTQIYTNENKELKKHDSWYNLSYVLSSISFETFFIILIIISILVFVVAITILMTTSDIKKKFENQILEDKDLESYIKVKKLIDKILK